MAGVPMAARRPLALSLSLLAPAPFAFVLERRERPEYTIHRAATPIVVDGRLDEPAWTAAPDVGAFVFPWHKGGKQEQTVARMLWDETHLYVAFLCEDAHIWAVHTQRDSPVWRDDTVEVFTAPNPDRPQAYFNSRPWRRWSSAAWRSMRRGVRTSGPSRKRMIDDHGAAWHKLSVVAGEPIEWPAELEEKHRRTADELANRQGAEFDRRYLEVMIEGHQGLAAKLESRLDVQPLADWKKGAGRAHSWQGRSRIRNRTARLASPSNQERRRDHDEDQPVGGRHVPGRDKSTSIPPERSRTRRKLVRPTDARCCRSRHVSFCAALRAEFTGLYIEEP